MLSDLKQIDVIVTMEHSRLGREQTQTAQVLAQIFNLGRRVFFYLTDEEVKFETALDKFMVGAVGRRTLSFAGVTTLGPLLQKAWRPHGDYRPLSTSYADRFRG
jgi:hypothetical protein